MDDSPLANEGATILIRVSQGHAGDGTLYLRVSPEGAFEVRELMEEHNVFAGEALEFSAGPELLIYAGSFATGLTGLAAVIRAFAYRNRHKSITISHGDESVELRGLSKAQSDGVIDRVLTDAHQRQLEVDEKWRQYYARQKDQESESS